MSSTPTARNSLDKQGYGDNPDLWGINNLDTDLDLIDEALDGITTVSSTGGTYTLSATNFATNEARKRVLIITGTLTSALTVVIPNVQKNYLVINNTTGAYSVTINTSAGTGAIITQGCMWLMYCDGVGAGTVNIATMPPNNLPLPSAALAMNAQKITGLANGSAAQDAVAYNQLPGPAWFTNGAVENANFNAAVATQYVVDTTGGNVTATLPASPSQYDRIRFIKSGTGIFTMALNGILFNGSSVNPATQNEGIEEIQYSGISSRGWTDI